MLIREEFEKREQSFISPFGCLSLQSKGRLKEEPLCSVRTVFQIDRDRIVYSNAFRRLKHKTQVFLSPLGDHFRTRLTHTLEVAEIARTIARALHLNEDLTEAIALGHDLGHTPFGHAGETILKEIYSKSFCHNEHSLRVVDLLENNGEGLNLTFEVRDGILKHSKGFGNIIPEIEKEKASTIEGQIVRIADIMAYLNHDLDDAIRSRVIKASMIPDFCIEILGETHFERATTMIKDLIFSSETNNERIVLRMGDDVHSAMLLLRKFLYDNVYRSPVVHDEFIKATKIVSELYFYFLEHDKYLWKKLTNLEMTKLKQNAMPNDSLIGNKIKKRLVCDFIASMTDRFAMEQYAKIFLPSPLV